MPGRFRPAAIALCACAGFGGPVAASTDEPAPFRGLPVDAEGVPATGDPHTVFRVRFHPREFVGRHRRARRGYGARLLADHDHASCIIDTDGFLDARHPRRGIVLDPDEQMGNRWCRDHFSGTVTYYRAYACPSHGTCRPPKSFRDRHRRVARIEFTVR